MTSHQKAIFALIVANIIWGAASPIFKWSLENIQPFTLAFLRFAIASLILLPLAIKHLKIKSGDFLSLFMFSFFGIVVNITFFFLGLQLTSSINVPIIATSAPIFIIIGAIIFLGEKPKSKVIFGTLLALAGVLIVILRPLIEQGINGSILGNFLIVLATFGAVIHTIVLRKLAPNYPVATLTFWSFVIGAIGFLPLFLLETKSAGFLIDINYQGVIGIIFGTFISSALAYHLYTFALKHIVASEVGLFVYLDPVAAILIAMPLLGERITLPYLLGSLLVFLGIYLAERRLPYHPIHKL